jgi:hypothetical protein
MTNEVTFAGATTATSHCVVPPLTEQVAGSGERLSVVPVVVVVPVTTSISSDCDDGEMYVVFRFAARARVLALALVAGGTVNEKRAVIDAGLESAGTLPSVPPPPPPQPATSAAHAAHANDRGDHARAFIRRRR